MPLTYEGNGGGRSMMDQAAMNMMGQLGGGRAVPQGAQAPAPTADFAQKLAEVVHMVLQGGKAELLQFSQAVDFVKANLGGGAEQPDPAMSPMQPNPMGMAAQGAPQIGRPPR